MKKKQSYRRKQMLNWYRTANPQKWLEFEYQRWVGKVELRTESKLTMKEAIYQATEDELDDLYILREELRLGI